LHKCCAGSPQGLKLLEFPHSFVRAEEGAEKVIAAKKNVPQRLKPHFLCSTYGTAEAVPLTKQGFSAASETRTLQSTIFANWKMTCAEAS